MFCSRFLLGFQDGVEELEDKLLLFSWQEFDLFELSLKLRLWPGLSFSRIRLASKQFRDRNFQSGSGSFDKIQGRVRRTGFVVIDQ